VKPDEFVSRMADVFALETLGYKPISFSGAAMCIAASDAKACSKEENGYIWQIEQASMLDHVVLRGLISDGRNVITGSVCFNNATLEKPKPYLAAWLPTTGAVTPDNAESIVEMLTMLTLKTTHRIREA
jgi:hypothetical protein